MACGVALATTSSYFRQRKKKKKRARIHFYHPIFSPHVNIRIDQKNKLAAVQYVLFYVKKHQIFEPKKPTRQLLLRQQKSTTTRNTNTDLGRNSSPLVIIIMVNVIHRSNYFNIINHCD